MTKQIDREKLLFFLIKLKKDLQREKGVLVKQCAYSSAQNIKHSEDTVEFIEKLIKENQFVAPEPAGYEIKQLEKPPITFISITPDGVMTLNLPAMGYVLKEPTPEPKDE